jgi:hypothetical protein
MKILSYHPVIEISKSSIENFINVKKETWAASFTQSNIKTFGTVDLWNIQRQRKSRVQKRIFSQACLQ